MLVTPGSERVNAFSLFLRSHLGNSILLAKSKKLRHLRTVLLSHSWQF